MGPVPLVVKLLWWASIALKLGVMPRWIRERFGWRYSIFVAYVTLTAAWSIYLATLPMAEYRRLFTAASPYGAAGMALVVLEAGWLLVREFPTRSYRILLAVAGVGCAGAGIAWRMIWGQPLPSSPTMMADLTGGAALALGVLLLLFWWGCRDLGYLRQAVSWHGGCVAIWAGASGILGRAYSAGWLPWQWASLLQVATVALAMGVWIAVMRTTQDAPAQIPPMTDADMEADLREVAKIEKAFRAGVGSRR